MIAQLSHLILEHCEIIFLNKHNNTYRLLNGLLNIRGLRISVVNLIQKTDILKEKPRHI